MPFVPPEGAPNERAAEIAAVRHAAGAPPWRAPLAATPNARWVLSEWPAGFVAPAHRHPHAEEAFFVLEGRGAFRFGDGAAGSGAADGDPAGGAAEGDAEIDAPAGTFLFAPRGMAHTIRVPGPQSLLLLVCVTPNEDRADETVDLPGG